MERTMARPSPVPPPERARPENAVKAIKDPLQMGWGDSLTHVGHRQGNAWAFCSDG